MFSTYAAKNAICNLLIDSQTPANGLPFSIDASVPIYSWEPPDYNVTSQYSNEGVYIYFKRTRFNDEDGETENQTHYPFLNIDVYIISPATEVAGVVTQSVVVANDRMEQVTGEIYQAISNAEFNRLLYERLSNDFGDYWEPSIIRPMEAVKLGVLQTPNSERTLIAFRFVVKVDVMEIHTMNPGILLDGRDDILYPKRKMDGSV